VRKQFILFSILVLSIIFLVGLFNSKILWSLLIVVPLISLGLWDFFQTKHSVLRNFPIVGHARYILEMIRPEINQYFIESNSDGVPFSREQRTVVYQRAKKQLDTLPFGTRKDVYEIGYEWLNHSLNPVHVDMKDLRIRVGGAAVSKTLFCKYS